MGFDRETARVALLKFSGQIQKAVEELLKVGGELPPHWITEGASSSTSSSSGSSCSPSTSSGVYFYDYSILKSLRKVIVPKGAT